MTESEPYLYTGQGAIMLRAHDLPTLRQFYLDLGLRLVKDLPAYVQFDLGGAKLDIGTLQQGTPRASAPVTKEQVPLNVIIRTRDAARALELALAAGGRHLETVHLHEHILEYVLDPENNLIGLGQLPG